MAEPLPTNKLQRRSSKAVLCRLARSSLAAFRHLSLLVSNTDRNATKYPQAIPTIVGDYTLGKTLGVGSSSRVRLAVHNATKEEFAIKKFRRVAKGVQTMSRATRMRQEAALTSRLHHPHICSMRETIVGQGDYYIVFEYLGGGTLLDHIISHGRLRERSARKFARQIGSALDYCHRNSVVHRNLKIENIFLTKTGDIKIGGFGLATTYDPRSRLSTFCSTSHFPAPELIDHKSYIGPEVDVWNFGVVLYILVCGKVPFDDHSMPALLAKVKSGRVEYPAWLSATCKNLLSRMLAVDPAVRISLPEVLEHSWMR